MNKLYLFPYKEGSRSAKALAQQLGIKKIKTKNSKFKGNIRKTIINWGSSAMPPVIGDSTVINTPEAVAIASNKLLFFKAMAIDHSAHIPAFTTDRDEAAEWIANGATMVCRTLLRASEGRGIVLAENAGELVAAPLYTKYIPKKDEYRIHIFKGEVFDQQQKARCLDVADEDVNWKVRNHGNGFIFKREGVEPPACVLQVAQYAIDATGLDFGAVDVLYNAQKEKAFPIEINTAPGLEGTTLERYAEVFGKLL